MVCRLLATSTATISKRIEVYLGWEDATKAPVGHHIFTNTLQNTGLHNFTGMLGYCTQDKGEEHFQCVNKNVTATQLNEGVQESTKHGTPFTKNRIVIERAAMYYKYKLKKQLENTLPGTLLPILRSGKYIPSASWVLPVRHGGMEYSKVTALWKCTMNPDAITTEDVTQIFFSTLIQAPHLADLGRQCLAANLDEAREDDVPAQSHEDQDDTIVLQSTQNAALREADFIDTTGDGGLRTSATPMYIPVIFGDHDVHNNSLLQFPAL